MELTIILHLILYIFFMSTKQFLNEFLFIKDYYQFKLLIHNNDLNNFKSINKIFLLNVF